MEYNIIRAAVDAGRAGTEQFLQDLIGIPSTPGQEEPAIRHLAACFANLSQTQLVPLPPDLAHDPEYSGAYPEIRYQGRHNLRLCLPGAGGGRSLLVNTHVDVVPPSETQERPFEPRLEDGVMFGRGACDAKGQVAAVFAALQAMKALGLKLQGGVAVHLVVEEEIGGNGALAMIRSGERADACLVLEPTDLRIMTSTRGALWYRIRCAGRSAHSGRAGDSVSALKMAVRVMEILEDYHARLQAASRGIPLFDESPNPMPILFGSLAAGRFPSMAPARAALEGMLGFLPNRTREQVMAEMRQAILEGGDAWLREHFDIEFLYRHDCHQLPVDHPLAAALRACCLEAGAPGRISAMTASCDAWLYHNKLGIPAVVFGPGHLRHAHADLEQISMDQVSAAAAILVRFLIEWCGLASPTG